MRTTPFFLIPIALTMLASYPLHADTSVLAKHWYCAANDGTPSTPNQDSKFELDNYKVLKPELELTAHGFFVSTSKPGFPVLVIEDRGKEIFLPYKFTDVSDSQFALMLLDTSVLPQMHFNCYSTQSLRDNAIAAAQDSYRRTQEIEREARALAREKELKEKAEAAMQSALNGGEDAKRSERRARIVGDIQGYMQGLLQQAWRIPSTARNGMSAVAEIHLFPSGEIDTASIVTSSGDQAFDRSVLQAIFRVERFDRVSEVGPIDFERSLRRTLITFRPNGLRW